LVDALKHYAYLHVMSDELVIDARGLLCPLPVLRLRKRMGPLSAGATVTLWADDPAAIVDVPHFCTEAGHDLAGVDEAGDHQVYHIVKG